MIATISWSVPVQGLSSTAVAALHAAVTEQIERFTGAVEVPLEELVDDSTVIEGWTLALAQEFLARLRAGGGEVQAAVIVAAAAAGGRIDRATVYAVADWNPDERSLKGFTRPVNRIVGDMRQEGLLPAEAPRPLEPLYNEARRGFQQVRGFEIPGDLGPLFRP